MADGPLSTPAAQGTVALLPCPFCRSAAKMISCMGAWAPGGYEPDGRRVTCSDVRCTGVGKPFYGDGMEEAAIAWWNSRAPSPEALPASTEAMDADEIKQRILGALDDYRDAGPEEDESWESWYYAAFDLASEKIAGLLNLLTAPPFEALPASGWNTDLAAAKEQNRILLLWKAGQGFPEHVELGWWSAEKGWVNTYGNAFSGAPDAWAPLAPFEALQAGVDVEAVVAAIEDQTPATQDMESTMICEALERAIVAVRALTSAPAPEDRSDG